MDLQTMLIMLAGGTATYKLIYLFMASCPPVHRKIIIYQKCKPAKRLGERQRRRKKEGKQKRKDEGNQSREWRDVIGDQRFRLSRRPLCIVTSWRPNPKWFQCVCGWRRDIQEEIKPRNNFIMHTPCFPCTPRNRMLQVTPLDDVESLFPGTNSGSQIPNDSNGITILC